MILVVAIVASIAVAWLQGGRFSSLTSLSVRWGGLSVAAFALQSVFIFLTPTWSARGSWGWQELLFVGSHLLLLTVVWANRGLPGVKWIGIGLVLNLLVMVANGGWMPISPEAMVRAGHLQLVPSLDSGTRVSSSKSMVLPREETTLWFLSDIFVLGRPFPLSSVFSVGDVLVALGAFLLIQNGMLNSRGWIRPLESNERSRHDCI